MLVKLFTILGKTNIAPYTLKERNSNFLFKVFDRVRKRRLRNVETFGSFTIMLILSKRAKVLQLSKVHTVALPSKQHYRISVITKHNNRDSNVALMDKSV